MEKILLDYEQGLLYCADSEEVYLEILTIFCEQYEQVCSELEQCLQTHDWTKYTIKIHALKNNARNIGAGDLGERCFELELAGKKVQAGEDSAAQAVLIEKNHPEVMQLYERTKESALAYIREKQQ